MLVRGEVGKVYPIGTGLVMFRILKYQSLERVVGGLFACRLKRNLIPWQTFLLKRGSPCVQVYKSRNPTSNFPDLNW